MPTHPSHVFGDVDGTHCCARCYCEPDWPLAASACSSAGVTDLAVRRALGQVNSQPRWLRRPEPEMDNTPFPEWWSRERFDSPRVFRLVGGAESKILITHMGKTLNITQWSDVTGIMRTTLTRRIGPLGWSPEKALRTPAHYRGKRIRTSPWKVAS